MARPSRTALYANDPTFLWKIILRAFSILIALIGIAAIGWAYSTFIRTPDSNGNSPLDDYYDDVDESSEDFLALPWSFITLGLSVLWNVTNIAVLLLRNKPILPGANVACDLLLWPLLIATGVIASFDASNYQNFYDYGSDIKVNDAMQHKGIVIAVGVAMSFLVSYISQKPSPLATELANPLCHSLFHFALFISACRYEHARRRGAGTTAEASKIAQQIIAVLTGPNGSFRPRTPPQYQAIAPQYESSSHGGMQQSANATSTQPSREISGKSSILDLPPPGQPSSSTVVREVPEIKVERVSGTHPALRAEKGVIHDA